MIKDFFVPYRFEGSKNSIKPTLFCSIELRRSVSLYAFPRRTDSSNPLCWPKVIVTKHGVLQVRTVQSMLDRLREYALVCIGRTSSFGFVIAPAGHVMIDCTHFLLTKHVRMSISL